MAKSKFRVGAAITPYLLYFIAKTVHNTELNNLILILRKNFKFLLKVIEHLVESGSHCLLCSTKF